MNKIRLVIAGAAGRMGKAIVSLVAKHPEIKIVAGLEADGHPAIGQDLGTLANVGTLGVIVQSDALSALSQSDAVIDFTQPHVSVSLADLSAQARIVHVIGTTGFASDDELRIQAAARHATIIKSGNMSLGVNLLAGLVEMAARALGPTFDVEIVESHHRMKVDSPSGTALLLGQAAARARDKPLAEITLPPHHGLESARAPGSIGFASVRAGSIVGDHTVIIAGDGERLELVHRAEDRAIFATGALKAAVWGQGKGPGLFDMQDVLGLRRRI